MSYYPVMLSLKNRRALFIGGGWETEIKVRGLLEAGAHVTLVSKYEHPELEPLAQDGRIVWHKRDFEPSDLDSSSLDSSSLEPSAPGSIWLVMSHTKDKADNHAIFALAEARGILCNSVDDPERCSFILPSVVRRGDLIIGISTSGTAPALGVRIKQKFNQEFGPEYTAFLEILRQIRSGITAGFESFETRKQLWYALIDSAALEHVRHEDHAAARGELERVIQLRRLACGLEQCAGCSQACPARSSAFAELA
jgi:precorrin-2 dehydrogenase / sirohydrochlorin ferrochelatase